MDSILRGQSDNRNQPPHSAAGKPVSILLINRWLRQLQDQNYTLKRNSTTFWTEITFCSALP